MTASEDGTAAPGNRAKARRKGERAPAVTRAALLEAGIQEFAAAGFGGARTDRIARRANSNERSLYYYFGSKQGLYIAALEHLYDRQAAAEAALELDRLDPRDGLRQLIAFTWRYYQDNPEFLGMLATENLYRAKHLRDSEKIRAIASPKMRLLEGILARGVDAGHFRRDITATDLFLTFSGLLYFYLSNRWTLSGYLDRDLDAVPARDAWLTHVTQLTMEHVLRR